MRKNLRNAGETVIVHNLCPNVTLSEKEAETFVEIIENTNFNNIKSYWPIGLCCAWWGLMADKQNQQ